MNNPFTRKTSSYTLTVEIPGASDEVLKKLLDAALVEALGGGTVTGSWFRRLAPALGIHVPFVALSYRAEDDAQAAIYGARVLRALGRYDADLHTGYGAHKRHVATTRPETPAPGAELVEEIEELLSGNPWNQTGETK